MAKSGFMDLLLGKGEKIAVGVAGLGMLGLIGLGVSNAFSGDDPKKFAATVTEKAAQIKNQIATGTATVDPLPDWTNPAKPYNPSLLVSNDYAGRAPLFDQVAIPSTKRANPIVLGVTEFQADTAWAKVESFDMIFADPRNPLIGVYANKRKGVEGSVDLKDLDRARSIRNRLRYQPPAGQQGPGGMQGPGGVPGQGTMPPPGGGEGGMPQMGGGAGGGRRGGNDQGFMMPGGGESVSEGQRNSIEYVRLLDDKALDGKEPALTIHPQRMIILNASFPYKLELDRIREALRLQSVADIYTTPDAVPVFMGVNVQRKVFAADGKTIIRDWAALKYEEDYRRELFRRLTRSEPENPDLDYVKLDKSYGMWMFLPGLMPGGKYPEVKIPSILATIDKFKRLNLPPAVPRAPDRLRGEGDIFSAPDGGNAQGGTAGPGGEGGRPGQMPVPTGNSGGPGAMPFPGGGAGGFNGFDPNNAGQLQNLQNGEAPEAVLIRILDVDVQPELKYQYRMQVKMKNPNYRKKDMVSRPSDADIEMLLGEWVEMKDTVSFPRESYVYAVDDGGEKGSSFQPKDGQALLQYQRWLPEVKLDSLKEPIGDWVVTNVLVNKGQYVGGLQLVNVPIWDSILKRFKFRDQDPPAKGPRPRELLKGLVFDPTRNANGERYLVVDIEGGRRTRTVGNKLFTDESASEILLMDNKGKLSMLTSASEEETKARKEREEKFKRWLQEVDRVIQTNPNSGTPGTPSGTPGRFGDGG